MQFTPALPIINHCRKIAWSFCPFWHLARETLSFWRVWDKEYSQYSICYIFLSTR